MSIHSFADRAATRQWIKSFVPDLKRPCLVLLEGELGAGKTQFVRWFLEDLGVQDVASPTYAIHHEYTGAQGPIAHVDLYRVKSDEDLESSGFWDLFLDKGNLVFVEWADRLPMDVWPKDWTHIQMRLRKVTGQDDARELEMSITTPLLLFR